MTPAAREKKRAYYQENKARINAERSARRRENPEAARAADAVARERNRTDINAKHRAHHLTNREKNLERKKAYREKNKDKIRNYNRDYERRKKASDLNYKLAAALRGRLAMAIKNGSKRGSAVSDLGCSILKFKAYIEGLFQPGMNWDNWGRYTWHLDHVDALANFDLMDPEQVKVACHYTNLQPLWAADNLKKGNRAAA